MNDEQLLRYSRHILLPEIDVDGQQAILDSSALIVGVGGLGSPAALYLASAGVGHLVLADGDTVDLSNLQRQILHREDHAGMAKVESGRLSLASVNAQTRVDVIAERLVGERLEQAVAQATVVLDCSDNYATRQAVNAACVRLGKPLVAGAVIRFDAQITVIDPRESGTPCYACLFDPAAQFEEVACSTMGVFAPLVGVVGALQATEALKLVAGVGTSLAGRLLMLDGRSMEWSSLRTAHNPACPVCGTAHIPPAQ